MVDTVKRKPADLFGWPLLGILFKNRSALLLVRALVMFLFLSALYFGFAHPSLQENPYTTAIFWSLFWPFFMIVSLVLIGPAFCGICPHGVMGRWLSKAGLNKEMPKWLRRRGVGLGLLITLYWVPLYLFPGLLKTPWVASLLFLVLTVVAAASFYLYKEMSYCTYLCPIGAVTKSFGKMGMVKLQTYQSECGSCKTFDCAKACASNLQPFLFEKKNSMRDCTLCMDCAQACEAVSFSLVKPSSGLFGTIRDKSASAHTWVYLLLLAVITITMRYHHGLGHSPLKEQLPWAHAGHYLQTLLPIGIDWVGFSALAMALASVALFVLGGFKLASMALHQPFGTFLHSTSYALAPLMLIGSLSHVGSFFFLHYYSDLANAFYWLIGSDIQVAPLATFKDKWVHMFGLLGYAGVVWSLVILTGRIRITEGSASAKTAAWLFSSAVIWFYLALLVLQQFAMRMGHH